jgi:hypothetical protein
MAAKILLSPQSFVLPASNGGRFRFTDGSSFTACTLAFDATTTQSAYATAKAIDYTSGNITCVIAWYADSATSGDVVWDVSIAAITPETDTQDFETKAFDAPNAVTDSHLGTTAQRLHEATITISSLDSLAANDVFAVRLRRVASDGADTMTGDAQVVLVTLSYS